MRIPAEARDGLSRAWLEILKARHPETTWVLTHTNAEQPEPVHNLTAEDELATVS